VQDWLTQSRRARSITAAQAPAPAAAPTAAKATAAPANEPSRESPSKKKLSYKEQRELDQLPDLIARLEAEQKQVQEALADGSLYTQDAARAAQLHAREAAIEAELMSSLERWEILSA